MAVLIKGAKPPSGCRWCYFNEDGKCALIVGCDFDDMNGTQRRKDCPLIELPDHGDLIDRDVVADALDLMAVHGRLRDAFDMVMSCEAVIPAERSEE